MYRSALVLIACSALTACGTYELGRVHPQHGKTGDQQQLDTLSCKDEAKLAVSSTERRAGNFIAGMTLVGVPVAIEAEKAKAREVFSSCMQNKGYLVAAVPN